MMTIMMIIMGIDGYDDNDVPHYIDDHDNHDNNYDNNDEDIINDVDLEDVCDDGCHVVDTRVGEVLQKGSILVVNSDIALVYLVDTTRGQTLTEL